MRKEGLVRPRRNSLGDIQALYCSFAWSCSQKSVGMRIIMLKHLNPRVRIPSGQKADYRFKISWYTEVYALRTAVRLSLCGR